MAIVSRVIKNGRVKINKCYYRPRELYNGELNGLTANFGTYKLETGFVSLHSFDGYEWDLQPNHKNGFINWIWWYRENEE